jgi:2-polyprenyl-3-methyl-5-hydroxy-6-metoxy-1,4-benzoquinol methylase
MDALCPFCNARSYFRFRAKDLNSRITEEPFDYYRCLACGLVYLSSIPVDLAKYYRLNYIAYDIPASLEQLEAKAEDVRFRLDMVLQYVSQKGRLLEIGPSYGGFAFLAKRAGFSIDAVEMDSECCRFLKDIVGVNTICADNVGKALEGLGQYDVIALWHVIEHLVEPWKVLDALTEHLLPNGIIVISTPNPDSFQFKLFGRSWVHLDAPRHVLLLPAEWLICFLEKRGVHKVMLTTTDPDGQKLNKFGWAQSFWNLLSNRQVEYQHKVASTTTNPESQKLNKLGGLNWGQHFQGKILYKIGRFVFNLIFGLILCPFERASMHGCAYTLIAKKDSMN